MKCFRHRQDDAVGVCKNCNKGVCPSCVTDVGDGIACRGECEEAVRAINSVVSRSVSVTGTQPRATIIVGLGMVVIGGAFVSSSFGPRGAISVTTLVLAAVFVLGGIAQIIWALRLTQKVKRELPPAA